MSLCNGKVFDSESQNAIPNVVIYADEYVAITDEEGEFESQNRSR